ncbi:WecB/TagA/CpsF family glycosyltransferase [Raoultella terrigena]|uniref:WecB/TagA/CpsF family glycosyltransferase n=1 Tax=Raoultella terrigena TaxID=577 RepID=UPI0014310201|nr:WecB/TagA/CpsF family glycosyltransferase [Raoultella terrigena]QIT27988.1 WecB/TagA/CpsF family glycosyltransferase [Raoultella terrigena]
MQLNSNPVKELSKKIPQTEFHIENNKGINTFLNCYSYYVYRKIANSYQSFDKIYCDGILFQKMVGLIGIKTKRISFDMTSLAPEVFGYAERNLNTVAIIGSEDKYLQKAILEIKNNFPKLDIIESRNGFFNSKEERTDYLEKLSGINPDIIIVGMGTPLQDYFLTDIKDKGWEGVGYTCGGFIHQTASKGTVYYPKLIDKYNLRWLYRIYDEPKLFKRYFIYYPLSIALFYYDYVRGKFNK